jgi:tRNA pseudouridine38-40 synthase
LKRILLTVEYDGTAYAGWQRQINGLAVQQVLEEALATLLRVPVPLVGAGRTDTGVNAECMVAHANLPEGVDTAQLIYKLNRILPPDIAVSAIRRVRDDAHARFDATSRRYRYRVVTAKSPFARRYALRVMPGIDFDAMNRAAELLYEYTDFTSFSKLHTDTKTNNCKIAYARWSRLSADEWVFEIEADRFLRNMVRAIVGTLLMIGRGKIAKEQIREIIEKKLRSEAGDSAPAQALFLEEVKYPEDLFL